ISVNATVPAVPAAAVEAILTRFPGCTTAKVKVAEPGHTLADDLDRVAAVRAILGPAARIRVDANGAWRPAEAVAALRRLAAYGLDYAEQPCASVAELRELRLALARARVEVRIAADESIRKAGDPLLVARREAADLIVVKVAPLGGVAHALTIVADCGLPAVVSSALDTSVGISAGVALAAALPALDGACGLGTVALLDGDVTRRPLTPVAGMLRPGRVTVDRELVHAYAAEQARVRWWQDRVRACWAELPPHRQG
ncbi:MAG TPA: o-succinylbenzoate synthase, partial [Tetrasphaera sp.]|nr:o-succinylbenzoate synthase [Tetrasphaera sp.]